MSGTSASLRRDANVKTWRSMARSLSARDSQGGRRPRGHPRPRQPADDLGTPPQQPRDHRESQGDERDRRLAELAECRRQDDSAARAGDEQRHRPGGDHRRDRQRVEHILDCQRGQRRGDRHGAADARDLGRLADDRAERSDVAEGIAADDGVEGDGEGQAVRRLDADPPGGGAHHEAQPAEDEDPDQVPADLAGSRSRFPPGRRARPARRRAPSRPPP